MMHFPKLVSETVFRCLGRFLSRFIQSISDVQMYMYLMFFQFCYWTWNIFILSLFEYFKHILERSDPMFFNVA